MKKHIKEEHKEHHHHDGHKEHSEHKKHEHIKEHLRDVNEKDMHRVRGNAYKSED